MDEWSGRSGSDGRDGLIIGMVVTDFFEVSFRLFGGVFQSFWFSFKISLRFQFEFRLGFLFRLLQGFLVGTVPLVWTVETAGMAGMAGTFRTAGVVRIVGIDLPNPTNLDSDPAAPVRPI